jgi:hypothetical protein
MHYYDLGAELRAQVHGREMVIRVDDVTKCSLDLPAPALFWVNPPLSTNSLRKFQRRAAQTTEGVPYTSLKEIYQAIAAMIRPGDGVVWMMPDVKGIDKLLKSVGLDGAPHYLGTYHDKPIRVMVDEVAIEPLTGIVWSDDTRDNFSMVFGEDRSGMSPFECIVDPCAGRSPLIYEAMDLCKGYYGIEVASFEAFRMERIIKRYASSLEMPTPRKMKPSGKVVGAPDAPTHKPVEELRDFKQGKSLTEIRDAVHRRKKQQQNQSEEV